MGSRAAIWNGSANDKLEQLKKFSVALQRGREMAEAGAVSYFPARANEEMEMRNLTSNELQSIGGAEIECTVGTSGVNCKGTLQEFGDALFGAYDNAVSSLTDFFCWVGGVK